MSNFPQIGFTTTSHLQPYDRLSASHLRSEFAGKAVLITGGGTGIGAAAARSFAEANVAAIVIAGRTEETLKSTTAELVKSFPEIQISHHCVDITSQDSVKALFGSLTVPLDILVNNAGYLPDLELMATARIEDWWKGFEVNVLGTTLMTRQFLSHREAISNESKEAAVVVSLNTMGAFGSGFSNFSSYSSSKLAIMRALD